MQTILSQPEFLAQWRLHRYLEPLRNDCAVTRTDGIDLDAILITEMEQWYFNYLDTAPGDMLVSENIAATTVMDVDSEGVARIPLETDVRRILEVKMSHWQSPATIVTDTGSIIARRQLHKFTRGGAAHPVAVVTPGLLTLYTAAPRSRLTSLAVVHTPEPGTYPIDTRALSLIKSI